MRRFLALTAALALAALAVPAAPAQAGTVYIQSDSANSTEGIGGFTGSISYDDLSTLTVTLKNTTPVGGGFITGFLFNIVGDAVATLAPNPTGGFVDLRTSGASNALDGNPFGSFEAGAALGGKFLGGGSPNNGIAVGDEATFVFNVTGADAADLTVEDFLGQTSAGNADGSASFLVRFRGINFGAGSDKVPGTTVAVPLPPAAWTGLATLGLAGFASMKRRALRLRVA
jgi:hypothetical protein